MKRIGLLVVAAAIATSSANAQILLSDNFNGENAGASALNFSSFLNWNVVGQVDLVAQGSFGLNCAGGVGSCVDLDGTSGPGRLVSKTAFTFATGDAMRISFDLSGNQGRGAFDVFQLGLNFGSGATLGPIVGTGGLSVFTGAPPDGPAVSLTYGIRVNSGDPFSTWSLQFTAATSGSVTYSLGTTSSDDFGPILDNVVVQRFGTTTVPEPSTWALMAFGMGAMGLVARRRTRA